MVHSGAVRTARRCQVVHATVLWKEWPLGKEDSILNEWLCRGRFGVSWCKLLPYSMRAAAYAVVWFRM